MRVLTHSFFACLLHVRMMVLNLLRAVLSVIRSLSNQFILICFLSFFFILPYYYYTTITSTSQISDLINKYNNLNWKAPQLIINNNNEQ